MSRPTPVEAVFGPLAEEWFPILRRATEGAPGAGRERDAFVLVREVAQFLRELRPEDQAGEGIEELVAFVHAAFLHWVDGSSVLEVDRATLDRLVLDPPAGPEPAVESRVLYLQFPARRVWGHPLVGEPAEPLDGCFVSPATTGVECLAVFGLHPSRPGLTVVRASGSRPRHLQRPDGSRPFAPRLEGGAAAGLHSVVGAEELLELSYRTLASWRERVVQPGRQRLAPSPPSVTGGAAE